MSALTINPIRLSAPMGAMLAFLGVKGCMPLMHGAQGCASFSKVFFTRHFHDPIPVQTTAVSDITAIMDGGDKIVAESIDNILKKISPDLIGLISVGLTETKGDDLRAIASRLKQRTVWVSAPDYHGGLESGFAMAATAIIEQIVKPLEIDQKLIALLPHASMTPLDVESLKETIESFGFECVAVPDLSDSLDGHLGEKQGQMTQGGAPLEAIERVGGAYAAIAIGASMKTPLDALCRINPRVKSFHFDSIGGLQASDKLIAALTALSGKEPCAKIKRWRSRLADMLLDTHFVLGKQKVAIALEADHAISVANTLSEAGAKILIVAPTPECALDRSGYEYECEGLFWLEQNADRWDMLVCGTHGEAMCRRLRKPHLQAGFPQWERVGSQLDVSIGYEGSARALMGANNGASEH
ncbi:MAG: nitrogenase iron-molybdenum cofactor biosynthesis protein NifN [Helicobacteraceae bacterium]|nr:nitrogenase iron-molybdenum cofactor biosynthesis protein NifN [Helicobacteraceae bacterium]